MYLDLLGSFVSIPKYTKLYHVVPSSTADTADTHVCTRYASLLCNLDKNTNYECTNEQSGNMCFSGSIDVQARTQVKCIKYFHQLYICMYYIM